MMQLPVKQKFGKTIIEVNIIRLDGGTQPRDALDERVAREYGANMRKNGIASFPPINIYYDGTDYWLSDGFHRVYGAKLYGITRISADIRQGTLRDAVLDSVGANSTHGMRRTNADKRRSVLTLLNDPEWAQWSDREIARQCAVDAKTVGNIRREAGGEIPQVRLGVDGKTYHVANIGHGARYTCSECGELVETDHQHFKCENCGKTVQPDDCHVVGQRWLCETCASKHTSEQGQLSRQDSDPLETALLQPDKLCLINDRSESQQDGRVNRPSGTDVGSDPFSTTFDPVLTQAASGWKSAEMAEIYQEWQQLVARKRQTAEEYHRYAGGDYRIEGQLAIRMAAAQAAEQIARRSMLRYSG